MRNYAFFRLCGLFSLVALVLAYVYPFHLPPWATFYNEWLFAVFVLLALVYACHAGWVRPVNGWIWLVLTTGVALHYGLSVQQPMLFDHVVQALVFLMVGYLAYVLGFSAREGAFLEPVLWALCVAGVVSVAVAVYQWVGQATGEGWQMGFLLPWSAGNRVGSNLGQANNFGMLMVVCLWATYVLRERGLLGKGAWLFGLAVVLWVVGLYLSGSRAALLNLLLAVPLVWVHAWWKGWRLPWSVCLPVLIYAVLVLLNQAYTAWASGTEAGVVGAVGLRSMVEDPARVTLWRFGLDALGQHLWWGVGQGGVSGQYLVLSPVYGSIGETIPGHVHNTVLDLLLSYGLLLGGALVGFAVYRVWRAYRACHAPADLWLFLIVLGLCVHAMVEYPLNYGFFFWLFCLMLGVGTASGVAPVAGPSARFRYGVMASAVLGLVVAGWMWLQYVQVEALYTKLRNTGVTQEEVVAVREKPFQPFPGLLTSLYWGVYRMSDQIDATQLLDLESTARHRPYSSLLWKAAVGNAFLGRPDQAAWWLERLCAMYPSQGAAAQEAWQELGQSRAEWPEWPGLCGRP